MSVKEYFADIKWIKLKASFALAILVAQLIALPPILKSLDFITGNKAAAFAFTQILVGVWLWALLGFLLLPAWMFFDIAMGNIRNSAFSGLLWIGSLGTIIALNTFIGWVGN